MIALYPGSFDPVTYGHIDILERTVGLFDRLIVGVAVNTGKSTVFTTDERIELLEEVIDGYGWDETIIVEKISGLVVNHAVNSGAKVLLRGVRQCSDFEYEYRMMQTNHKLDDRVETMFLMPRACHAYLSASLVREIAYWGGDLSPFVPDPVARALHEKHGRN